MRYNNLWLEGQVFQAYKRKEAVQEYRQDTRSTT